MTNMLERAVPRYTSYPTAPNFSPAVDAEVYRSWLAGLPGEAALSLYLHVPFCRELCHYCGCHTKATLRDEPIIAYAQRLVDEIALIASHTGQRQVTHIHWGGGTPSILDTRQLQFIADKLARHFDLSAIREHAIELDPRYLTRRSGEGAARHRRQSHQPRRAGLQRACAGGRRPHPAFRHGQERRRHIERFRHRPDQHRFDVRPAQADRRRRATHRQLGAFADSRNASRSSVTRMCPGSARNSG